jgi:hypothetical protein
MKKIIVLLIVGLFSLNLAFAGQVVYNSNKQNVSIEKKADNIFVKIKTQVVNKIDNIKQDIKDIKKALFTADLKLSLILMVIGLIFFILAGAVRDGGVIWAIGVIFFLIGAILLLFNLLGVSI